ncbi:hypothetical protein [Leifsonia sp. C5G2]|uniref:hypothetical protein n=1 Tax=Leifsonia sp. C5G2 TaxID=2735269 RepID=UPI0015854F68|nr:hypothetical protein [Leifsonia sp. C5G2]NUU06432.1 hypothetical protein [Leifsonia sp. C5G2]
MASSMTPGYRTAMIGLRPPRVALLFPGWENWRGWARLALETVTGEWGGGGHLIVPYDEDGSVDEELVRACTAFDPDRIELLTAPPSTWAKLSPEWVARTQPRSEDWSTISQGRVSGGDTQMAITRLLEATSVMQSSIGGVPPIGHPRLSPNNDTETAKQLEATEYFATDPSWTGDAALFAGAVAGVVRHESPNTEPSNDALIWWLMNPTVDRLPAQMEWGQSAAEQKQVRSAFEALSDDTTALRRGWPTNGLVIVIGDTAQDFGLALAFLRLHGSAIWLTPENVREAFPRSWQLRSELQTLVHGTQTIHLISASLKESEVDALALTFDDHHIVTMNGRPLDTRVSPRLSRDWPPFDDAPLRLMLTDHISTRTTVAVPVNESERGTFELVTPLDSPLPQRPRFQHIQRPAWIVDVDFDQTAMPGGRGLPPQSLLAASNDQPVSIRASMRGVSFEAGSDGVTLGGTVLPGRVARPTLRIPGLEDWVTEMAHTRQLTTRISQAGRHAALLARRLGGRDRLIDVVSGPLHPYLREYLMPNGSRPLISEMFPARDGVVVSDRILLNYQALKRLTPSIRDQNRRDHLDNLLAAEIVTQGLVLNCAECEEVFFVTMDDLGIRYPCPRCGAINTLSSPRWRRDGEEPSWFYDLHPALRALMKSNGDAVLLAAAHFRGQTWLYRDTHELEFMTLSQPPKKQFEIDLIARMGDRLVVCEVKSNGEVGGGSKRAEEIRKRFKAATLLRADQVSFVSIDQPWADGTKDAISRIQKDEYPRLVADAIHIARPTTTGGEP